MAEDGIEAAAEGEQLLAAGAGSLVAASDSGGWLGAAVFSTTHWFAALARTSSRDSR